MDISAKVLREVEFRDRLRGYDTDEVDDFLERAALGFEELTGQLEAATERAERAERQAAEMPASDDDSIKRTLVLAQRTADMAVKEAQAEAESMLADARANAAAILNDTKESAERARASAEQERQVRISQLDAERDRLEREIATLVGLVESEQNRLQNALRTLLGYVDGLAPTEDVREAAAPAEASGLDQSREPTATEPVSAAGSDAASRAQSPLFASSATPLFPEDDDDELDDDLGFPLVDVEREVAEDADRAVDPAAFRERLADPLDPDEALWDRWAKMGDSDQEGEI